MFKVCPRCRDEFLPHVAECPDCRVALRTAEELASEPVELDGPSAAGAVALASAVLLRRGAPSDLRELCERLGQRGVRFVVGTHPLGGPLGAGRRGQAREVELAIYVEEADAQQAAQVEREWVLETIPGAAAETFAGTADACPGCGEPLGASAVACDACGLEFPPLEVACPQCGQPVAVEAESCAICGHRP
jgi:hypothetical protein